MIEFNFKPSQENYSEKSKKCSQEQAWLVAPFTTRHMSLFEFIYFFTKLVALISSFDDLQNNSNVHLNILLLPLKARIHNELSAGSGTELHKPGGYTFLAELFQVAKLSET